MGTIGQRLDEIKEKSKKFFLRCIFIHAPHYTDHSEVHCKNIERHLENFLQANPQITLNDYEDFLLKCAIWLHDVGMVRRKDEKEDLEETRKNHHIRSKEIIDSEEGRRIFGLDPDESNIVGTISFLHARKEDICKEVERHAIEGILDAMKDGKDFKIDLKKLSMLLRLLDACDREYTRAYDINTMLEQARLPEPAMYHWAHSRITSVRFNANTIELHSLVPPPAEGETKPIEETMIDTLITNSIGREIDSLGPVLEKYGLKDLNVRQVPRKTATDCAPQAVIEQYRNLVHSSKFLPVPGFINRSIKKSTCIFKSAHAIVDITCDILVTSETGVNEIVHSFFADESAIPTFKFIDLRAMQKEPIENRWRSFWFDDKIFEHNTGGELSLDVAEQEGIESPLKAKFIKLIFSRTLEKGSKIKYGTAYSAPGLFDVSNPDKIMASSLFIPRETNEIFITLKIENGLIARNLELIVSDASGTERIRKEINEQGIFLNNEEGEFTYCTKNSFYYTEYNFKIKYPQRDRKYLIQWRFLDE